MFVRQGFNITQRRGWTLYLGGREDSTDNTGARSSYQSRQYLLIPILLLHTYRPEFGVLTKARTGVEEQTSS